MREEGRYIFKILQGILGCMTVHFTYTRDSSVCWAPYFMDGNLAHAVTFPKEFREVAYGFVYVFCSVLHILFYIKINEIEHLGHVETFCKTFL